MSLKRDFIEAVRVTPEGIAGFLTTPLPEAPTIATPTDVDAAIIANGVCAKFVLDLFAPFAGLTPIELMLRIGQHNTVLESAMLAGLEYIEGADPDSNMITIIEPLEGVSYTPGEMRFSASVTNGFCVGMVLLMSGGALIKMIDNDGTWQQYVNMERGDYTATFTASFEDTSEQSASVSFTIAEYSPEPPIPPEEQPNPPGGTDNAALERKRALVFACYHDFVKALYDYRAHPFHPPDVDGYRVAFKSASSDFVSICPTSNFTTPLITHINSLLLTLGTIGGTIDVFLTNSSAIMNDVNTLYVGLTQ